jgi:NADH:ubiquinone oxidoreductase subunit D
MKPRIDKLWAEEGRAYFCGQSQNRAVQMRAVTKRSLLEAAIAHFKLCFEDIQVPKMKVTPCLEAPKGEFRA